jgi:hypothetical protein
MIAGARIARPRVADWDWHRILAVECSFGRMPNHCALPSQLAMGAT